MSEPAREQPGDSKAALLRSLIIDVESQFKAFPVPEGRLITPIDVSPEKLRFFGLPPEPDPETQPRLYRAWRRVFGQQIKIVPFAADFDVLTTDSAPYFRQVGGPALSPGHFETSRNWSGAYITANNDQTFRLLWGEWRTPNFGPVPAAANQLPYACSAWIGLDGQRRYFNASLPQIGTTTELDFPYSGQKRSFAWTQWWDRESKTTVPVPIFGFPLAPTDEVSCSVIVASPTTAVLTITNLAHTPPVTTPVLAFSPIVNGVQPQISGATAEWILERPRVPFSTAFPNPPLVNFPPYAPMQFGACFALEVELPTVVDPFRMTERDLQTARFIRMYERLHGPERTAFISMPSRVDEDGVALTYGDFGH